ncbi:MAG: hypothetical protein ACLSE8_02945 [Parasutterella sp.]
MNLPVNGGFHLKEVAMGKNILNYDSMPQFTAHFKVSRHGQLRRLRRRTSRSGAPPAKSANVRSMVLKANLLPIGMLGPPRKDLWN